MFYFSGSKKQALNIATRGLYPLSLVGYFGKLPHEAFPRVEEPSEASDAEELVKHELGAKRSCHS